MLLLPVRSRAVRPISSTEASTFLTKAALPRLGHAEMAPARIHMSPECDGDRLSASLAVAVQHAEVSAVGRDGTKPESNENLRAQAGVSMTHLATFSRRTQWKTDK